MTVLSSVLFIIAIVWETVYTVSYACDIFKKGNKCGGVVTGLLPLIPAAIFIYITFLGGE